MPPADYSSIQKSRRIYGTGPQSAHLWWPAVANLQAASMPIAMGQTDGRTDGRIARSLNAPYRMAGHDNYSTSMHTCVLVARSTQDARAQYSLLLPVENSRKIGFAVPLSFGAYNSARAVR